MSHLGGVCVCMSADKVGISSSVPSNSKVAGGWAVCANLIRCKLCCHVCVGAKPHATPSVSFLLYLILLCITDAIV